MLGGVREGVTVCDRGEGVKSMWRHTYTFFYHTYETCNLKWFLTLCCNICILTEGEWTKTTPDKNFQTKDPLTKAPRQKPPRTVDREFVQGAFVRVFCTRPTKNRGVRDVWRTFGGSRDVWQSVTGGRGSKLAKNSVTYFMDGPQTKMAL